MLSAPWTKLAELETLSFGLLVFRVRVIPLFALSTLERYNFTHLAFSKSQAILHRLLGALTAPGGAGL